MRELQEALGHLDPDLEVVVAHSSMRYGVHVLPCEDEGLVELCDGAYHDAA